MSDPIALLEASCELTNDEQIVAYAAAAEELPLSEDPDSLKRMVRCLRDIDAGDVQYELVEACERFPAEIYIPVMLEEAAQGLERSPQWFGMMLQSIFNSDEDVDIVVEKWPELPSDNKNALLGFLKKLNEPKYNAVAKRLKGLDGKSVRKPA
jgi:hypothetical protein